VCFPFFFSPAENILLFEADKTGRIPHEWAKSLGRTELLNILPVPKSNKYRYDWFEVMKQEHADNPIHISMPKARKPRKAQTPKKW